MSTTNITITDGLAWFEDGTSVKATVEQIKLLPQLIKALDKIHPLCDYAPAGYDNEAAALDDTWQALRTAKLEHKAEMKANKEKQLARTITKEYCKKYFRSF